ncbi:MAG: hypothetical protein KC464_10840 [Myxococcales bacterium]|nr:hypothetical protein [Myxococcales bacterium]
MKRLALSLAVSSLLIAACACKSRGGGGGPGPGTGTGTGTGTAADCDGVRRHVEELYRADPSGGASDEAVADNVAMVMSDCARDPGRVAGCAGAARTVNELETRCLVPLDDEGSEGDRFRDHPGGAAEGAAAP